MSDWLIKYAIKVEALRLQFEKITLVLVSKIVNIDYNIAHNFRKFTF